MKYIKGLSLLLCLLLALTAVFTACDSKTPAADTTASDTAFICSIFFANSVSPEK